MFDCSPVMVKTGPDWRKWVGTGAAKSSNLFFFLNLRFSQVQYCLCGVTYRAADEAVVERMPRDVTHAGAMAFQLHHYTTTQDVVHCTHSRPGARFTKYLMTILRLSYDNAKVTIDLRRTITDV